MRLRVCLLCESTSAGASVTFRLRDICRWCEAELARTGRAWCTLGRHAVPAVAVGANGRHCKACRNDRRNATGRADYARQWRATHTETDRAYRATEAYKARRRARERARYHADREAARARLRLRHARTAGRRAAAKRARYWQDPARFRARTRRWHQRRKIAVLREIQGRMRCER